MKTFEFNLNKSDFDFVNDRLLAHGVSIDEHLCDKYLCNQDSSYPFYHLSYKQSRKFRSDLLDCFYTITSLILSASRSELVCYLHYLDSVVYPFLKC